MSQSVDSSQSGVHHSIKKLNDLGKKCKDLSKTVLLIRLSKLMFDDRSLNLKFLKNFSQYRSKYATEVWLACHNSGKSSPLRLTGA